MTLFLTLLPALGLLAAPLAVPRLGPLQVTRLYAKARASEAFVRTGMGGLKVVQDENVLERERPARQVASPVDSFLAGAGPQTAATVTTLVEALTEKVASNGKGA